MKRYERMWITIEWEDKHLAELHLLFWAILYCLLILLMLSWIARAFIWINPKEEREEHQQVMERLESVERACSDINEPRCYFDDNTWYWWTNIPCPKNLQN